MTDNKLQVLKKLQNELSDFLQTGKAYECLKVMCADSIDALQNGHDEKVTFTRWKLKARYEGSTQAADEIDPKELQKWIDDKKLNIVLTNIIQAEHQPFQELGYFPVVKTNETKGGKGNEKLYWLDIEKKRFEIVDQQADAPDEFSHIEFVEYHRSEPSAIKISWFYRFFFKNGEMKNRSLRGLFLISVIFSSVIFWLLYLIVVALVLVREGQSFTSFNLLILFGVVFFTWLLWKYEFIPIWNLPEHRVIKAPMIFLSLNELDAEIEMYRDKERNQITRFTRFTATCPICTADIVLRDGKPDQNAPLVGRCAESPFAHVYSFDRVTMKGKYLGV
ncbi:hypothetical protein [Acinetobacter sp. YT-02]|uniref:hypothetical protein n=1 Tax=Acinetobacter sp. YT-02 TaxID=2018564 RepID=UPI000BCBA218|nr:hypothetical protein [Acinetobacter sp. YT-02]PCN59640.1 hypothetical protein CF596_11920 [Acinetobacter sp. YT-02]